MTRVIFFILIGLAFFCIGYGISRPEKPSVADQMEQFHKGKAEHDRMLELLRTLPDPKKSQ